MAVSMRRCFVDRAVKIYETACCLNARSAKLPTKQQSRFFPEPKNFTGDAILNI